MTRAILLSALALTVWTQAWAHDEPDTVGFDERPGAAVGRDLEFRDETGAARSLGELVDRPTILAFEYFDCSDGCGLLLSNLATALRDLDDAPGSGYRVLTVSFDPADTPELATRKKDLALSILGRPTPPDGWRFLSGQPAAIEALTGAVGFRFERQGDGYTHPLGLVFLSRDLRVTRYIRGERFLPADLELSLLEASKGTLGPAISRVARFCFRVDPEGRRLTFNALKVTGTVTLSAVAVMFIVLIRSGRKRTTGGTSA